MMEANNPLRKSSNPDSAAQNKDGNDLLVAGLGAIAIGALAALTFFSAGFAALGPLGLSLGIAGITIGTLGVATCIKQLIWGPQESPSIAFRSEKVGINSTRALYASQETPTLSPGGIYKPTIGRTR